MAKAGKTIPEVGDKVFINDADCPAVYGIVSVVSGDVFTVDSGHGSYDLTLDVLEVDGLPF